MALAGPFLVSAAFAQVLAPAAGVPVALAAICMCFVIGWTVAVAVAQSGSRSIAGPALLVAAVAPLALLVPLAGGPSSPLFLSFVPLLLEPVFVARTRYALIGGAVAAAAAIMLGVSLSLTHATAVGAPAAWFWLVPLVYAATLWLRREAILPGAEVSSPRMGSLLGETYPGVTMRLSPNGEVAECSAQANSLLKLDPQFLLGTGLLDRVHVADRIAFLAAVADMREGETYRTVELRLRLPTDANGQPGHSYRPFVVEFLRDEAVEDGFVAILRENTTVVRLREELDTARGCAETEKIRFLATVSHELRTPLNTIIGFSDMLLCGMAGPFGNERQREYTGLVRESGEHLLAVVNAILDVAKLESGTYPIVREHFRMLDAVETSKAIMSYQASAKGVELDCRVEETVGEVHADKRALQQILINLLSNAVKFTPAGGNVTVQAQRHTDGIRLSVSDTGIGIAEEDLPRIGKPFVQVLNDYTRQYEGTGLGLSLVRGLVELHGGSMAVESAPGMGTSVEITIPFEDCTGFEARHDAEILTISRPAKRGGKQMKHSVSRREIDRRPPGLIGTVAAASGTAIVENPVLVGSSTAFLVVLFYVSANALWYQPFPHPEPLLQTRFLVDHQVSEPTAAAPVADPAPRRDVTNSVRPQLEETVAVQPPAKPAAGERTLARIQSALKELELYSGEVDGLSGPKTRQAISDYQKTIGLPVTGEVSDELLEAIDAGAPPSATSVPIPDGAPVPEPRRDVVASIRSDEPVRSDQPDRSEGPGATLDQTQVVKIQAGLRAFGNEGIEIDGVMGEKTRSAVREFQTLFGLPVTGQPDTKLLEKMAEIGLTN